jgi:hypothetical protein
VLPDDQIPMPPKDRLGTHQKPQPAQPLLRKPVQQRRQKRPVGHTESRPTGAQLSLEHRDPMPQGQDLDVLRPLAHG